jgi:hypothetical protein
MHPHKQSILTKTMFLNVRIDLKAETKKIEQDMKVPGILKNKVYMEKRMY